MLDEERLKTQKLESIGTLAGGIAHDFNNLLHGIFGNIAVAKLHVGDIVACTTALEEAEAALRQAVGLTGQLLTFARGGKPVKKLNELGEIIRAATRFTLSGSRVMFRVDVSEDLWPAEVDEGQLAQVIQNVVLNADQSMPFGGAVVVCARNDAGGALPPGLKRGSYVAITISDTGVGIPEVLMGRLFDPYFTTKKKGTGLGLATSYSIIRNHGGTISVKSKPGAGSSFTIWLPAMPHATVLAAAPKTPAVPTRKLRVLVMDDEEMLLRVSLRMYAALGHQAEIAHDGQEAIDRYRAALEIGKRFDLVVLDLTVRGGMGGAEAVAHLLALDPTLVAVASSGYSGDETMADYLARGFKAFLRKPYGTTGLREMLAAVAP